MGRLKRTLTSLYVVVERKGKRFYIGEQKSLQTVFIFVFCSVFRIKNVFDMTYSKTVVTIFLIIVTNPNLGLFGKVQIHQIVVTE